ncbi:MAG: hypothetical protein ACTSQP_17765 [Promethearchaeota archaeon]
MSSTKEKIFKSSSLSIISVNLQFIFGIINTFFIARLISPEEWAFLLLIFSIINFSIFIGSLFPLGIESALQYFIPITLNKKKDNIEEILGCIFYCYKRRISLSLITFLLYIIIIFLIHFESKVLEIAIILSPLIITNIIQTLTIAIFLSFQKFFKAFLSSILNPIIITTFNTFIYIFQIENPLFYISISYLFGSIINLIFSIIMLLPIIFNMKSRIINKIIKYNKQNFSKIQKKIGINLLFTKFLSQIGILTLNLLFLRFNFVVYITYLMVCENIVSFALNFSSSKQSSYISIFTEELHKSEDYFKLYFYALLKYSLLIGCFLAALMFFFIKIYILIIYSNDYLIIVSATQLFIFIIFPRIILRSANIIISSTNTTKIYPWLTFIEVISNILLTLIAILFFNFFVLILLYVISSYAYSFISIWLINKFSMVNLKSRIIYKPLLLFIASFLLSMWISITFYVQIFTISIVNDFINGMIYFLIFLFFFYLILYFTKYITKEEFNQLLELVNILNLESKYFKKLRKFLEKFFPSKKRE